MKMEQVRKSIEDVLGHNDEVTTAVMNRLIELGVTCEGDLVELQVDDLTPSVLLPIPARKVIRHWSKSNDENHNSISMNTALMQQHSSSQSMVAAQPGTPALAAVPVTPSSLTTTPPASLDCNGSGWVNKFDVGAAILEMINQGQLTEQTAARHLIEGKPLPHAERNEVIRYLTSCILKVCSTPCRKSISVVSEALVTCYPQLRDEIAGTVIGPGYLSVRNQLENRVAYLKRPLSNLRRAASARRRLVDDEEVATSEPKKRMRDGYGCIDFLPVHLPDGETNDSLKMKHLQLKTVHQSTNSSWNGGEISQLMQQTYILQRQDLVGCRPLSVRDIQVEWPFLCEPRWMLEHLQRLLGISVLEKLEANLMAKKETLFQYLRFVAPTMKCLSQKLSQVDVSHSAVGVILLLMSYFGETESVLFHGYEVSNCYKFSPTLVQLLKFFLWFTVSYHQVHLRKCIFSALCMCFSEQ
jgi:hypothetical protein